MTNQETIQFRINYCLLDGYVLTTVRNFIMSLWLNNQQSLDRHTLPTQKMSVFERRGIRRSWVLVMRRNIHYIGSYVYEPYLQAPHSVKTGRFSLKSQVRYYRSVRVRCMTKTQLLRNEDSPKPQLAIFNLLGPQR